MASPGLLQRSALQHLWMALPHVAWLGGAAGAYSAARRREARSMPLPGTTRAATCMRQKRHLAQLQEADVPLRKSAGHLGSLANSQAPALRLTVRLGARGAFRPSRLQVCGNPAVVHPVQRT